jgi:hypothetical protein
LKERQSFNLDAEAISRIQVPVQNADLRFPQIFVSQQRECAKNLRNGKPPPGPRQCKIRGQLFKAIRQNFQPISEPGYSAIDFQVGGTIDRPSTNLMDRLVGRNLSNMINSFFGSGKKERAKKKKKQIEEAVPAAPSTSASPQEALPEATATPTPASSP